MKRIIYFLLFTLPCLLHGQNPDGNYNPYVNNGLITPSPLLPFEMGGTGTISFSVGNSGTDALDVVSGQSITLTITLSFGIPDNADPLAALGGTAAGLFSWSYLAGTYTATQTSSIGAGYSGTITIAYRVAQNSAFPGTNGFNVNITPAPYQTGTNNQNDDAESYYTYTELRDYGDAPASYGSADHIIDFENYLGTLIDGEPANQPSANADADDLNGLDDEDGVTFPEQIRRGETITIDVLVTGAGRLNAWIDWNGDGDFEDAGERIVNNALVSGLQNIDVTVPAGAIISAPTFARFRLSSGTLTSSYGSASGGEVEDYQITILCALPVPTLQSSDNDNAFCEGTSITFTAGGGTNYDFRINGNSVQDGTQNTYTTSALQNGQVVDVIVSDETWCSSTSVGITNTLHPIPVGILTSSENDNTFCEGSPVNFTATGGTSYEFRVSGVTAQSGASSSFTTSSITNGQVVDVIVMNTFGCADTTEGITHTVHPLPLLLITGPAGVCSPATVDLTNPSITEGSTLGLTYTYWTDGAGTLAYSTPTTAGDGTYFIRGTIEATGCYVILPVNVTVNPTPTAPTVTVVNNCNGTSDLSTTAPGSLLWSTGGTTSTINVTTAGNYTVTVTADGCTSEPGTGTANPGLAPAAPTLSSTATENLCPQTTVNLTALVTSTNPVGGNIFYKTANNPVAPDLPDPSSVGAGTWYIFYQGQDGCYSTGTEVVVTINNCPPDLTPTLVVSPNIMHGITDFDLIVRVTELNQVNTSGQIILHIPKDSRLTLPVSFVPSLTAVGTTPVNNSAWTYSENATNHIFTSSSVIPAGGYSNFGFRARFDPGSARGIYTITAQLVSGAGGEVRVNNNVDSERVDYFQE